MITHLGGTGRLGGQWNRLAGPLTPAKPGTLTRRQVRTGHGNDKSENADKS